MRRKLSFILSIALIMIMTTIAPVSAAALQVETVGSSKTLQNVVPDGRMFKVNKYTLASISGSMKNNRIQGTNHLGFYVNKSSGKTYTNPLTLTFQGCGLVMGEDTRIVIEFLEVKLGKEYNRSRDMFKSNKAVFCFVKPGGLSVGTPSTNAGGPFGGVAYGGEMHVKTRTTVYSMKTGKVMKFPFASAITDIDKYVNVSGHYCAESCTVGDGFVKYYKWPQNILTISGRTFSSNKKTETGGMAMEGVDSYRKAGVVVESGKEAASMVMTNQCGANVGTGLVFYSAVNSGKFRIQKIRAFGPTTDKYNFSGIKFGLFSDSSCKDKYQVGADIEVNKNTGLSDDIEVSAGTYWIKELSGNDWYKNDPSPATKKITVSANDAAAGHVYTFSDPPKTGTLTIVKEVSGVGAPSDFSDIEVAISSSGEVRMLLRIPFGKNFDLNTKKMTSGTKGRIKVSNLPYGSYTIKEDPESLKNAEKNLQGKYDRTVAAKIYETTINKNNTTRSITISNKWNEKSKLRLKIKKKISSGTGSESKKGIKFNLYSDKACKKLVGSGKTDSDGIAYIKGIEEEGRYYLKETVPSGYSASTDNPLAVEISRDDGKREVVSGTVYYTISTNFTNKRLYPKIVVTKKELLSDGTYGTNVAGIRFALYDSSGNKLAEKTTVKSSNGKSGTVTFSNSDLASGKKLVPGTYTVKEMNLASKYKSSWSLSGGVPSEKVKISAGETGEKKITCINTDTTKYFTLSLNKAPAESIPNGLSSYNLNGIVYGIYSDSACTKKITEITLRGNANSASGTAKFSAEQNASTKKVYVKEISVPSGSGFKTSSTVYPVTATANATVKVTANPVEEPLKKASLSFSKVFRMASGSHEGDKPDPSLLTFTLTSTENPSLKYTASPDANGLVSFKDIFIGKYKLSESGLGRYPKDAYDRLTDVTGDRNVTVASGSNKLADHINEYYIAPPPPGSYTLNIRKSASKALSTDTDTYDLTGITYSVYEKQDLTGKLGTVTLSGNGNTAAGSLRITKEDGPDVMDVYIREDPLPSGYMYERNTEVIKASIPAGESASVTASDGAVDDPVMASLSFTKEFISDPEGVSVPDADKITYILTKTDAGGSKTYTTYQAEVGKNGVVSFPEIEVGTYILREAGLTEYTGGDMTSVTKNSLKLSIKAGENTLTSAVSSSDAGEVSGNKWINKWTPEKVPGVYGISAAKTAKEEWDLPETYSLEGITYSVYEDAACTKRVRSEGENVVISLTGTSLKASGEKSFLLYFDGEAPETKKFYVKEDEPPAGSGFLRDEKVYEVTAKKDDVTPVLDNGNDLTDLQKSGRLSFTKVIECGDPEIGEIDPEKLVFTLTHNENAGISFTASPDSTGLVKFSGDIPLGEYTLTEDGLENYDILPDGTRGHLFDATGPLEVSIGPGDNTINTSNIWYNNYMPEENPAGIDIIKETEDPVTDKSVFRFTVTDEASGKVFADKQALSREGILSISGLKAGRYRIHEDLTEEQLKVYDQPEDIIAEVKADDEEHVEVIVNNVLRKTTVKVIKRSSDGNVGGIAFSMSGTAYDPARGTAAGGREISAAPVVTEETVLPGETEPVGIAVFTDVIAGDYVIEEKGFPEKGYVTSDSYKVEGYENPAQRVTSDGMNEETVTFVNIPVSFSLTKRELLEDGSEGTDPVAGAGYTLFRTEGAVTSEDDIISSPSRDMYTGEDGTFTTKDIRGGTYWLYETKVPEGYVDDRTLPDDFPIASLRGSESGIGRFVKTFTISEDHPEENVYDRNRREYGSVYFSKEDDAGNPVEGAEFTLYTDEARTKTAVNKDGREMRAVTDDTGSIIIEDENGDFVTPFRGLTWGTYWLEETVVPRGYKKADILRCEVKGEYTEYRFESAVINEREKGSVKLTKTEEGSGRLLSGAVFDLYTSDGELIASGLTTGDGTDQTPDDPGDNNGDGADDGEGVILYEGLSWGAYYFKETSAPPGYTLDSQPVRFSINRFLPQSLPVEIKAENKAKEAEIIATVKIRAEDYWKDHGDPTFIVTLEGDGTVLKKAVTFDEDYVKAAEDGAGYAARNVTFSAKVGRDYRLYIEEPDRFALDKGYKSETPEGPVTSLTHASLSSSGEEAEINIPSDADDPTGRATFVYIKNDWSHYGDQTAMTNIIKKSKTYVALSPAYRGDSARVPAGLLYDPDEQLSVFALFDDGSSRELPSSEYAVTMQGGLPLETDEDGDIRWPKTPGSYTYDVTATIKGVTHTGSFTITVVPAGKVKIWFHYTDAAEAVHISGKTGSGTCTLCKEDGDYIEVIANQKLGKAVNPASLYMSLSPGWTGHELITWSRSEDDPGDELSTRDEISQDTHYYAVWDTSVYRVVYNRNLSDESITVSGMPSRQVASFGKKVAIKGDPSADKGYVFTGWNTKADGTGTSYAAGSEYSGGKDGHTDLFLYAQWAVSEVRLKYDANDKPDSEGTVAEPLAGFKGALPASGIPAPSVITYGSTASAAPAPVKTGYKFVKWNTRSDGSGYSYAPGDRILSSGVSLTSEQIENGITLYAQWKQLHLGDNGGTSDNGDLTWEDIETIGNAGVASAFFSLDFTTVHSDLADGLLTADTIARYTREMTSGSETMHAVIAGFSHDKTADGNTAAITFMTYEAASPGLMERDGRTPPGWKNSNARTSTMVTLLSGLDGSLRPRLQTVIKKSVNSSGSVDETEDRLFLPSIEELYGVHRFTAKP